MEEKKDIDIYEHMAIWHAFIRRHDANIFDVFFHDKENLTDEDVKSIIGRVSAFLQLPIPVVRDKCETIAKVMTSENAAECELYYDWQLMEKAGVNNKDTLTLVIVHEMSHQLLYPIRFLLFDNEMWIQELAADMLVGGFSVLDGDVTTGKYKYILSELSASLTHPDGKLRAKMVVYGRDYTMNLIKTVKQYGVNELLKGLPTFVYGHYSELQESWGKVGIEDVAETSFAFGKNVDVEALPNNTYGTRLLEEYKKRIKEKQNENNGQ